MKIETSSGVMTLAAPSREQRDAVARYLPGSGLLSAGSGRTRGGLPVRQGRETWAVKQQTVDCDRAREAEAHAEHSSLVVLAFRRYLRIGFPGILMPAVYALPKKRGRVEVGVAYFGSSAPAVAPVGRGPAARGVEEAHGKDFPEMVAGFINCMAEASKQSGVPLHPIIGLEYHPASALGALAFSFLIHGKDLYCVTANPSAKDTVWGLLRSTGIRKAWAMPVLPVGVGPGRQLAR